MNGAAACDGLIGKCSCYCFWQLYTHLTFSCPPEVKSAGENTNIPKESCSSCPTIHLTIKAAVLSEQELEQQIQTKGNSSPCSLPPAPSRTHRNPPLIHIVSSRHLWPVSPFFPRKVFSWPHTQSLLLLFAFSKYSLLLKNWPKAETFPTEAFYRGSGSNWSSLIHCYLISGSGSRKNPSSSFPSDGKHSRIDFLLGNLHEVVGIPGETQHFHFPRWWSSLFWSHSLGSIGVSQS